MKLKNIKIWFKSLFVCHIYEKSTRVELVLSECIKSGISSYSESKEGKKLFRKTVIFNNNVIYEFWDVNKYYAWLSDGEFIFPNPELNFKYKNSRPSYFTLMSFNEAIKNKEEQLYKEFLI